MSSPELTQEYRSYDDGLTIGYTYTTTALPGGCIPPIGNYVEVSSSASMSSQGPVETKTYMPRISYEIKKRIIVDTGGNSTAYAVLQQKLPPLVSPTIYDFDTALKKIHENVMNPVNLLKAFGLNANNKLSSLFNCVNSLQDMVSMSHSNFSILTQYESFSIDFLMRTFYQGMGVKIIIDKDGSTLTVIDIAAAFGTGSAYSIPGEDIMSYQHSLDTSQIPHSYMISTKDGKLTSEQPSVKRGNSVQMDAMRNRASVLRDQFSNLSTSVTPTKAIEFGMFKFVTIIAAGSSAFKITGGKVEIRVGTCINETITCVQRTNKLDGAFTKTTPSAGKYDYSAASALIMNFISGLFKGTSLYDSMYRASQGVVVCKGVGIITPWSRVKIASMSVEAELLGGSGTTTLTTTNTATHLVTSVEEIVEAGIPRSIVHFVNLDL